MVGLAAALLALALVAGCLENESRTRRRPGRGALTLVYVPLLVPQIGFLFGIQVLLVTAGLDGMIRVWPVNAKPPTLTQMEQLSRERIPYQARGEQMVAAPLEAECKGAP